MTDVSIDERVLALVSGLTQTPASDIRAEHDLREDLGLDSVGALELVALFSEELGVEVDLEKASQLRTVGALLAAVRDHAGRGS
jgi:acyl carrier protein